MIICEDECEFLNEIANFLSPRDVELVFVDNEKMHDINFTQRGFDKTTDVLSFPLENIGFEIPLGSVVINLDLAQKKAKELNHSLNDEISLLFIHAMLHLLGFDHEKDQGQMREEEERLIKHFNLPQSLIIRTLG